MPTVHANSSGVVVSSGHSSHANARDASAGTSVKVGDEEQLILKAADVLAIFS